ncbi:hypothetical protein NST74_16880 [Paenibacillus sp. FSL F4-0125]|uniref:hypothetical protein n=1 Tax=Paenibacillus sp. FSL F4-0125 TaxID=2954730 RepID=UPI0030FCE62A
MTLLRMLLSRYLSESSPVSLESVAEREIIRLAYTLARPLRPIDVEIHLNINHRSAVRMLHSLCTKKGGGLSPVTGPEGKYVVKV